MKKTSPLSLESGTLHNATVWAILGSPFFEGQVCGVGQIIDCNYFTGPRSEQVFTYDENYGLPENRPFYCTKATPRDIKLRPTELRKAALDQNFNPFPA